MSYIIIIKSNKVNLVFYSSFLKKSIKSKINGGKIRIC